MRPSPARWRPFPPHRGPLQVEAPAAKHILVHMKQILVELDDRCARDLERVAPSKDRSRPLPGDFLASDLAGWDEKNGLARPADKARGRGRRAKSAA
jgi:hypothetical protein